MSANKNNTGGKEARKRTLKVGKLQCNSEAVTDLTAVEAKKITGGVIALAHEQTHHGSSDDRTNDLRAIGAKVASNMDAK